MTAPTAPSMINMLCLDPSLTCSGWAQFHGPRLIAAGIAPTSPHWSFGERVSLLAKTIKGSPVDRVVMEFPEIYSNSQVDANQLLKVAAVCGACCVVCPKIEIVLPKTWKQQVPKKIHNARVMARLDLLEKEKLANIDLSLIDNAIDAVGIGLYFLGRMGVDYAASNATQTVTLDRFDAAIRAKNEGKRARKSFGTLGRGKKT